MRSQLHKRFSSEEVAAMLKRYLSKEIGVEQGLALLKIGKTRFFSLLKRYQNESKSFSVEYQRKEPSHRLDNHVDGKIMKELEKEKKIIEDKKNPVRFYNYSYLKNVLEEKHGVDVSLSTIIRRAKKMGFIRRKDSGSRTTVKS